MDLSEICGLPVAEVAAKNSHLYLWVPNALLVEGLQVMDSWGYRYISNVIWAKRRKDGGPDGRGVGFYFRNVTEILLFGVRGSMRTLPPARSQVNMIETRKREHSRKPDEQYDFIERCSPGPRLEMFARHPQPGWTVWGDEASEDVTPRGRVHRGYAGGEIQAVEPIVKPGIHLPPDAAETLGKELRIAYEGGKSIRQVAEENGVSIGRARKLLLAAGTEFRGRGRPSAEHA